MDLQLNGYRFLVCGASSGFGRAIAETLLSESDQVECIVTARRGSLLQDIYSKKYGNRVTILEGDLTQSSTLNEVVKASTSAPLQGAVLNAGGPPTGTPMETSMEQWDEAFRLVMRWKIDLSLKLVPHMTGQGYGRLLFVESKSIKQPIPYLVLSNSFRAGIAGFAKSLATEIASKGVTVNLLAPGAHDTPAITRVIERRSKSEGISFEQAKAKAEESIPVGRMGKAEEIASLAAWLLSPHASYVTGQTISHDGGAISGLFG